MKIHNLNQYNQGIGKYKLLSSTAGVGSIITTKVGSYVLISDINKWKFIKWANSKVELIRKNNSDDRKVYEISKTEMFDRGFDFIDDQRFIRFIKIEKELSNLVCLIGVPHMALNESYNTPNWNNHPIKKEPPPCHHFDEHVCCSAFTGLPADQEQVSPPHSYCIYGLTN